MGPRKSPPSLYACTVDYLLPYIEKFARNCEWEGFKGSSDMERLPASVVRDLLLCSYTRANDGKLSRTWKDEWKIYYTSKIIAAILFWNEDLIDFISERCKNLQQIEVVQCRGFSAGCVARLPRSVTLLDFDGELVRRGTVTTPLLFRGDAKAGWLPDSEEILKALQVLRRKPPELSQLPPAPKLRALAELHLGTVPATAEDLKGVLQSCPCLRLLRHYQLVTALYQLHAESWRSKGSLPTYKLRNLDVDFSHVVRCRMSPEWVLAPEALQLAVLLCPAATSVRVRFDCSTPNYVLSPLLSLDRLKELSAVCVSSGERTLLDFSDMTPVLEKHGPSGLVFLELKVIEEVEIHAVIEHCTRLETLVLSGCGFLTPPTCPSFNCQSYARGSLKRLKLLFYADGDDFSWDHGVPECFWKAALFPAGRNRVVHLEGLFLEFPRIPASLAAEIFHPSSSGAPRLPFPELRVLSLCRYSELTLEDVAAVLGLRSQGEAGRCRSLQYLRLSECEQLTGPAAKRLGGWMKQAGLADVRLVVDS